MVDRTTSQTDEIPPYISGLSQSIGQIHIAMVCPGIVLPLQDLKQKLVHSKDPVPVSK